MPRRRPSRSRRGRRSRSSWSIGTVLLLTLLVAGSASLLGGYFYLGSRVTQVALDDDNCPLVGPSRVVSILIDVSDPLPPVGERQVADILRAEADAIRIGERLEVSVFDDDGLRVLFGACNPGSGNDVDQLTRNTRLAQRKFDTEFEEPVRQALASFPRGVAETSPIMSALQNWAVDHAVYARRKIPTELLLVSDMLENTRTYSQYRDGISYAAFKASSAARTFATDLGGAKVRLLYVPSEANRASRNDHVVFWERWFKENRATLSDVKLIQDGSLE